MSEATHQHGTCSSCHGPVTEVLTPLGKAIWTHDTVPLDRDQDVPGEWVSNGTGWVPGDDHAAEPLRCLNDGPDCEGPVEYRTPLSGTGKPFPRCDKHWSDRLDREEVTRQRYPEHAPPDFDPLYAGESWGEDY